MYQQCSLEICDGTHSHLSKQGNAVVTDTFMSVALFNYVFWTALVIQCFCNFHRQQPCQGSVVTHQTLTMEAWIQSLANTCNICCGKSGDGTGFLRTWGALSVSFHQYSIPIHSSTTKAI
jgi:hypothetical protein